MGTKYNNLSVNPGILGLDVQLNLNTREAEKQIQKFDSYVNRISSAQNYRFGLSNELALSQRYAENIKDILSQSIDARTGAFDLSKFNAALNRSNMSIDTMSRSLQSLGVEGRKAWNDLATEIQSAQIPLKTTNATLSAATTFFANSARWAAASRVINGTVDSIAKAFNYAQNLDKSLTNIQMVTGHSSDYMKNFAQQANTAAKALSASTLEYTNAALIYYQQGLTDKEVAERTATTVKMAHVTGESVKDVANQMTSIWNNFSTGIDNLERYGDVITKLGATTASSSKEIAQGLNKFSSIANTVGLSYNYAASAMATVTAATRQSADSVGTSFKTLFSRLESLTLGDTLEDGVNLNKYSQALMKVGVNVLDTNGQLKNMDNILSELGNKWNNIGKSQQVALAQTVGGVRNYTQLVSLMEHWDEFEQNVITAQTSKGALQAQTDIYDQSWQAAQTRFQAAAQTTYDNLISGDFFKGLTNLGTNILNGAGAVGQSLGTKGSVAALANLGLGLFGDRIARGINNLEGITWGQTVSGINAQIASQRNLLEGEINSAYNNNMTRSTLGVVNDARTMTLGSLSNAWRELQNRTGDMSFWNNFSSQGREARQEFQASALALTRTTVQVKNSLNALTDSESNLFKKTLDMNQIAGQLSFNVPYNQRPRLITSLNAMGSYGIALGAGREIANSISNLSHEIETGRITNQQEIDNRIAGILNTINGVQGGGQGISPFDGLRNLSSNRNYQDSITQLQADLTTAVRHLQGGAPQYNRATAAAANAVHTFDSTFATEFARNANLTDANGQPITSMEGIINTLVREAGGTKSYLGKQIENTWKSLQEAGTDFSSKTNGVNLGLQAMGRSLTAQARADVRESAFGSITRYARDENGNLITQNINGIPTPQRIADKTITTGDFAMQSAMAVNSLIAFGSSLDNLIAKMSDGSATLTDAFTSLGSGLMAWGTTYRAFSNNGILSTFGNTAVGRGIGSVISFGGTRTNTIWGAPLVSEAGALTATGALEAMAIAAIVGESIHLINEYNENQTTESKLERANELNIVSQGQAKEDTKKFNAFPDAIKSYTEAANKVSMQVKGTAAYTSALLSANEEAKDIIEAYDLQVGKDYNIDSNGLYTFSNEQIKNIYTGIEQTAQQSATEAAFNASRVNQLSYQKNIEYYQSKIDELTRPQFDGLYGTFLDEAQNTFVFTDASGNEHRTQDIDELINLIQENGVDYSYLTEQEQQQIADYQAKIAEYQTYSLADYQATINSYIANNTNNLTEQQKLAYKTLGAEGNIDNYVNEALLGHDTIAIAGKGFWFDATDNKLYSSLTGELLTEKNIAAVYEKLFDKAPDFDKYSKAQIAAEIQAEWQKQAITAPAETVLKELGFDQLSNSIISQINNTQSLSLNDIKTLSNTIAEKAPQAIEPLMNMMLQDYNNALENLASTVTLNDMITADNFAQLIASQDFSAEQLQSINAYASTLGATIGKETGAVVFDGLSTLDNGQRGFNEDFLKALSTLDLSDKITSYYSYKEQADLLSQGTNNTLLTKSFEAFGEALVKDIEKSGGFGRALFSSDNFAKIQASITDAIKEGSRLTTVDIAKAANKNATLSAYLEGTADDGIKHYQSIIDIGEMLATGSITLGDITDDFVNAVETFGAVQDFQQAGLDTVAEQNLGTSYGEIDTFWQNYGKAYAQSTYEHLAHDTPFYNAMEDLLTEEQWKDFRSLMSDAFYGDLQTSQRNNLIRDNMRPVYDLLTDTAGKGKNFGKGSGGIVDAIKYFGTLYGEEFAQNYGIILDKGTGDIRFNDQFQELWNEKMGTNEVSSANMYSYLVDAFESLRQSGATYSDKQIEIFAKQLNGWLGSTDAGYVLDVGNAAEAINDFIKSVNDKGFGSTDQLDAIYDLLDSGILSELTYDSEKGIIRSKEKDEVAADLTADQIMQTLNKDTILFGKATTSFTNLANMGKELVKNSRGTLGVPGKTAEELSDKEATNIVKQVLDQVVTTYTASTYENGVRSSNGPFYDYTELMTFFTEQQNYSADEAKRAISEMIDNKQKVVYQYTDAFGREWNINSVGKDGATFTYDVAQEERFGRGALEQKLIDKLSDDLIEQYKTADGGFDVQGYLDAIAKIEEDIKKGFDAEAAGQDTTYTKNEKPNGENPNGEDPNAPDGQNPESPEETTTEQTTVGTQSPHEQALNSLSASDLDRLHHQWNPAGDTFLYYDENGQVYTYEELKAREAQLKDLEDERIASYEAQQKISKTITDRQEQERQKREAQLKDLEDERIASSEAQQEISQMIADERAAMISNAVKTTKEAIAVMAQEEADRQAAIEQVRADNTAKTIQAYNENIDRILAEKVAATDALFEQEASVKAQQEISKSIAEQKAADAAAEYEGFVKAQQEISAEIEHEKALNSLSSEDLDRLRNQWNPAGDTFLYYDENGQVYTYEELESRGNQIKQEQQQQIENDRLAATAEAEATATEYQTENEDLKNNAEIDSRIAAAEEEARAAAIEYQTENEDLKNNAEIDNKLIGEQLSVSDTDKLIKNIQDIADGVETQIEQGDALQETIDKEGAGAFTGESTTQSDNENGTTASENEDIFNLGENKSVAETATGRDSGGGGGGGGRSSGGGGAGPGSSSSSNTNNFDSRTIAQSIKNIFENNPGTRAQDFATIGGHQYDFIKDEDGGVTGYKDESGQAYDLEGTPIAEQGTYTAASGQNNNLIPQFAAGSKGYIAMTGELGPELHIKSDGTMDLLGKHGREYAWVEPNDRIYTAAQTASILGSKRIRALTALAQGINNFIPNFGAGSWEGSGTELGSSSGGGNSGGGGGGGFGGGGGEAGPQEVVAENHRYDANWIKYRDVLERYYTILQQLEDLANELQCFANLADRAWGKERVDNIEKVIDVQEQQITAQRQYLSEINGYLRTDKDQVTGMIKEFVDDWNQMYPNRPLAFSGATFDQNGVLTNYRQIVESMLDAFNMTVSGALYGTGNISVGTGTAGQGIFGAIQSMQQMMGNIVVGGLSGSLGGPFEGSYSFDDWFASGQNNTISNYSDGLLSGSLAIDLSSLYGTDKKDSTVDPTAITSMTDKTQENDYQTKLEEMLKDIQFYTQTLNLYQQQLTALEQMEQQLFDTRLQAIQISIDYEITIKSNDLTLLDYELAKVKNDAYAAAEAVSLIGQEQDIKIEMLKDYEKELKDILNLNLNGEAFFGNEDFHFISTNQMSELTKDLETLAEFRAKFWDEKTQTYVDKIKENIKEGTIILLDKDGEEIKYEAEETALSAAEIFKKKAEGTLEDIDISTLSLLGINGEGPTEEDKNIIEHSYEEYTALVARLYEKYYAKYSNYLPDINDFLQYKNEEKRLRELQKRKEEEAKGTEEMEALLGGSAYGSMMGGSQQQSLEEGETNTLSDLMYIIDNANEALAKLETLDNILNKNNIYVEFDKFTQEFKNIDEVNGILQGLFDDLITDFPKLGENIKEVNEELISFDENTEKWMLNIKSYQDAITILGKINETNRQKLTDAKFEQFIEDPAAFWEWMTDLSQNFETKNFTANEINMLNQLSSTYLSTITDLKNGVLTQIDYLGASVKTYAKDMDTVFNKFDTFKNLYSDWQNIIDLTGRSTTKLSHDLILALNTNVVDNSINKLSSAKKQMDSLNHMQELAIAQYEKAKEELENYTGNDKDQKYWLQNVVDEYRTNLDKINKETEEAQSAYMKSWEDALQGLATAFSEAMKDAAAGFEESFSPAYSTFEALSSALEREKALQDLYLQPYESAYSLNKIARDIKNSILDTDNINSKKELKKLLDEINQAQENGIKLSAYDLDVMQKKYDLELARQALEDAKNAKTIVRLSRDNNGNWGYVYTANEEDVDEAEQNYENAILALENANEDYITDLQGQLLSVWSNAEAQIAALSPSEFENEDDYRDRVAEITNLANEQIKFIQDQMNNALNNNNYLLDNVSGNAVKIMKDLTSSFDNTILSSLIGTDNIDALAEKSINNVAILANKANNAYSTFQTRASEIWEAAGHDINDATGSINSAMITIGNASFNNVDEMSSVIERATTAFNELNLVLSINAAKIYEIVDHYEDIANSLNKIIKLSGEYIENNKMTLDSTITGWFQLDDIYNALIEDGSLWLKYLDDDGKWETKFLEAGSEETTQWLNEQRYKIVNLLKHEIADQLTFMSAEGIDDFIESLTNQLKDKGLVKLDIKGELFDKIMGKTKKGEALAEGLDWALMKNYYSKGEALEETTEDDLAFRQFFNNLDKIIDSNGDLIEDGDEYGVITLDYVNNPEVVEEILEALKNLLEIKKEEVKDSGGGSDNTYSTWYEDNTAVYGATHSDNPTGWDENNLYGDTGMYTGRWQSMDTGGYAGNWYTGEWANGSVRRNGRLAWLHQKELVLNAHDTENFLDAMQIVRQLDNLTNWMANGLDILAPTVTNSNKETLQQEVNINATFPNVTNHTEIEDALNNLVNRASQYVNRI